MRLVLYALLATLFVVATDAQAQSVRPPEDAAGAVEQGGGMDTLEDILARQRGEGTERDRRPAPSLGTTAADNAAQLGVQLSGGNTNREIWEEVRFGGQSVTSSAHGPGSKVLVQSGGMEWLQLREGPLRTYGGWFLVAVVIILAAFYLIRGRIRIDHGRAGWTIVRFRAVERFAHWLLAVSFLILAFTGLFVLFGRNGLMGWMGQEAYASSAIVTKWVHDNVSWAFMVALVMVFVFWVVHNLPSRTDLAWIRHGGGFFGGEHPPSKKFNLGQKLIFWSVIVFGASISASGLSLLFPHELPMFAKTFGAMNNLGIPSLLGREAFPTELSPQGEMQLAQLWHSIVAFVLMGIIIAHIYIGSIGMEGAFQAMGSGRVDANWAREHHSLWAEKKIADDKRPRETSTGASATPAE